MSAWRTRARDGPGHHRDPDSDAPWEALSSADFESGAGVGSAPPGYVPADAVASAAAVGEGEGEGGGDPRPSLFPGASPAVTDFLEDSGLVRAYNAGTNPNARPYRSQRAAAAEEAAGAGVDAFGPPPALHYPAGGYARWRPGEGWLETEPAFEAGRGAW